MYPANDSTLVDKLGELLGVDLDAVFSLVNLDGKLAPTFGAAIQLISGWLTI